MRIVRRHLPSEERKEGRVLAKAKQEALSLLFTGASFNCAFFVVAAAQRIGLRRARPMCYHDVTFH